MSFPQPHPSLPARPQNSASGSFKPPFSSAATTSNGAPGTQQYPSGGSTMASAPGTSFTGFKPRSVGTGSNQEWRNNSYSSISAAPAAPSSFTPGYPPSGYQQPQAQPQSAYPYPQQAYYNQPTETTTRLSPPQIRNPFPLPGQEAAGRRDRFGNASYDPELEAQIAQWQSAYAARDDTAGSGSRQNANTIPITTPHPVVRAPVSTLSNQDVAAAAKADTSVASVVRGADGKNMTVVRSGGGESWQDSSLLEWDPAHFRLFVGNLAGEVTDESLLKAFAKYDSVQKARVVRDKRTTKSKGYGFVSFSDGDQFFKAAKEMQGKYIGSHPVILRRSTTEIKPTLPADKNKKGKYDKGAHGGGNANTGAGVQKKQAKTKGGLKLLG